jgi:hypothetical protein
MKHLFIKCVATVSLFITASFAFANDIVCPSATLAKQAQLVLAEHIASKAWIAASNPFTFEDNDWNVLMVFLSSASTKEEALADGQETLINASLPIEQPKPVETKGKTACLYTMDPNAKTVVVAITPPVTGDTSVMRAYVK